MRRGVETSLVRAESVEKCALQVRVIEETVESLQSRMVEVIVRRR